MKCEDVAVFPKNVCGSCKRKLKRLQKLDESCSSFEAAEFLPHTDNCSLCLCRSGEKNPDRYLKVLDQTMTNAGFTITVFDLFNARGVNLNV